MNERHPRECCDCGRKIGPRFLVAFVQKGNGPTVGPFHPKCADKLVRHDKKVAAADPNDASGALVHVVTFEQGELEL
jgi:hypothetical protein